MRSLHPAAAPWEITRKHIQMARANTTPAHESRDLAGLRELPSPALFCLAARLDLCGDQPYLVHTGRMRDINHLSNVGELQVGIAFHKHDLLCARLIDRLEAPF